MCIRDRHSSSLDEFLHKKNSKELLASGAFRYFVFLGSAKQAGTVREIIRYDEICRDVSIIHHIGAGAVSYTHLDVYKRQMMMSKMFTITGICRKRKKRTNSKQMCIRDRVAAVTISIRITDPGPDIQTVPDCLGMVNGVVEVKLI